jgi:hypothetical protein
LGRHSRIAHARPHCSSPEEKDYNEFTKILAAAPENAHIVFNCQQGVRPSNTPHVCLITCVVALRDLMVSSLMRVANNEQGGRSTVGMVAAVLIQMWSNLKKSGLPFVPGFLPGASAQDRRRDRRGEYAAIMGLVRTLNQGTLKPIYTSSVRALAHTHESQANSSSSSLTWPSTAVQALRTCV